MELRMFEQLARRLRLIVDRAVVRIVTDSLGRQNLQVQTLADATNDDVERFQQYGFTSFPRRAQRRLFSRSAAGVKVWWR